ncbi:MAG TPA: NADH-quinone oxidoreductase subunit J [Ktedonobacteraceae bacterium]|jgi:NADH-quinone oxidoreductase subunit J|nr:NADH-quinone oxidoreductase subunit J [Ktedonobacteraceae bacterium]
MTASVPTLIEFFVLAVATVASGLGVIIFRSAVHSALSLILTLLFVALFYLQLGAMFIAVVQVLIYAGAIMVLFLFVVTMLASENTGDVTEVDRRPWQRGIAATLGLILVGALSYLLFTGTAIESAAPTSGANGLSQNVAKLGNTQTFGMALFHGFSFPFEITSLLIIVALLGAMVLGRRTLTRDGQH